MKLHYLFFYILIICYGCNSPQINRSIDTDNVLDYKDVLFKIQDSLPLIDLKFSQSSREVKHQLEKKINQRICLSDFYFRITDNNQLIHKLCVTGYCPENYIPCTYPKAIIEIVINRKGMYLFERETLEDIEKLDSLIFFEFFQKYNQPLRTTFVQVDWSFNKAVETLPKGAFYKALNKIENGYLLVYDSLSRKSFNKQLHNLNINELDSLQSILPFKINVGGIYYSIPPPPPQKATKLKTS
ncbi:MAG: hypothetical protein N4A35_12340 [Flavobacteriales bacterium]|jgi:hypothetical protein|nr:hypothetical protein [Flavobacteriales bacterium]